MRLVSLLCMVHLSVTSADYWSERENLIENDRNRAVGANVNLTQKEKLVNEYLMSFKLEEFDSGFKDPTTFLAQQHFFQVKEEIEKSKVFNIIRQLPKGASLHSHDEALVSQEYLYNLTFRENLYGCFDEDDFKLRFFSKTNVSRDCDWTLLSDLRKNDDKFEEFLKSKLTVICDDPYKTYPNVNVVWSTFQHIFRTITDFISYKPVFEDFFYQALKELYEDNVKYIEFRGFIPHVYDLEGKVYLEDEVIGIYFDTLQKFQKDYPQFFGAKFIYAPNRRVDNSTMDQYVNIYRNIKRKFPDFVAGFDLVGQEDLGSPLSSYIPQLLEIRDIGAKFFFHAGETNWEGESTDLNLFDAILLNSTRIGHGYALIKHPTAAKLVKQKNIAIEICPISNQVLKLVTDLRNHPGSILISNGFPVVIAPDDPTFWGAKGLSYDWYVAFMAMTSRETDLRFLKQLALNSIEYSSLGEEDKILAVEQWKNDWNLFVDQLLNTYYSEIVKVLFLIK